MIKLPEIGIRSSQFSVFQPDCGLVKRYRENYFEVVMLKSRRLPGFEERGPVRGKKNSAGNDRKLDASISRTRHTVFELSFCNPFTLFGTFTVDGSLHDRYDIRSLVKKLGKWLNNQRTRQGMSDLIYLIVPEQHRDGAWHFHALLGGLPMEQLVPFCEDQYLSYGILNELKAGHAVYNWPAYAASFGFCCFSPIREPEACARYISKYITKSLACSPVGLNNHLYFCSKGLKRAECIAEGPIAEGFVPDYANDYIAKKRFTNLEDALAAIDAAKPSMDFLSVFEAYRRNRFPEFVQRPSDGFLEPLAGGAVC